MELTTLNEVNEFDEIIQSLKGDWVFRGQSNSLWEIETSVFRFFLDLDSLIGKSTQPYYLSAEKAALQEFCSIARLYLQHLPEENDTLGWFSVMQHYGVPTRLLDVSCSPYVALFFAMENGTNDASVFCIKPSYLSELDGHEYLNRSNYVEFIDDGLQGTYKISLCSPSWTSERSFQQQGLFLVPNTLNKSFSSLMSNYGEEKGYYHKIIIPSKLRMEFIRKIIDMNITSSTLFPSLEGYSRSIKNLIIHYLSGAKEDEKIMPNKWFQRTPLILRR